MSPLAFDFMRHAYAAALLAALLCAPVGFLLVLRAQSFAGHALGHVGFAGAAGALLLGAPPLAGLVAVTVLGGAAMGALGPALAERDIGIGIVLSTALGLGVLFLNQLTASAAPATQLLFGNVLAVEPRTVRWLAAAALLALLVLTAQARPLLFATLQPELAEARGVRLRVQGMVFLAVTGFAVAAAAQVVGVLLVFSLLVAPAATARRLTARLLPGLGLTALLAAAFAAGGVTAAFYTDWPASFCITALGALAYAGSLLRRAA